MSVQKIIKNERRALDQQNASDRDLFQCTVFEQQSKIYVTIRYGLDDERWSVLKIKLKKKKNFYVINL